MADDNNNNNNIALLLYEGHKNYLQAVASMIPNSTPGEIPAIQLRLSTDDLKLINQVHTCSDWVLTVDRNFGVEYFDNPQPLKSYQESYLIDYTPEFLSNIGHRLILSTAWLSEIETILARSLSGLGILSEQLRPLDMLNALRSLSGRIALQVLSQPVYNDSLIGMGLAQIILTHSGRLQREILIPASIHPDLFGSNATNTLVLAHFEGRRLYLNLVAVRFCKGIFVADEYLIREEINVEAQQVKADVLSHLAVEGQDNLLDQTLRNKLWENVLNFYLERAIRYGFLTKDSEAVDQFRAGLQALSKNDVTITVDREGLIFNLQGTTTPVENYHDVHIQIIGRDELTVSFGGMAPTEKMRSTEQFEKITVQRPEVELSELKSEIEIPSIISQQVEPVISEGLSNPLEIKLGGNRDTGRPIIWAPAKPHPRRLTNQHILLVGKSGSGKTQTIMTLIYELWQQRVASLVLDFHGEYCDIASKSLRDATQAVVVDAAYGIPVNPLTVPLDPITGQAMDYRNVIYQVTESLTDIFSLGDIQKRILKRAIENVYVAAGFKRDPITWKLSAPSFAAIWKELRAIEREEGGTARNLLARVEPIFEAEVFQGEDQTFENLLHKVTIVRLSSLANKELRTAISRFFLQKVYERMLILGPAPADQQRLFCVIDEAHKLSHDPTITDLIKEARKYGVGLILSSQETRDFDRSIFANSGTIISLQLEIEDARIMVENLGLQQATERSAAIEIILRQHPGLALIRNNHYQPYTQVQIVPLSERLKS